MKQEEREGREHRKRLRQEKENREVPVYKSCTAFGSINSMRSSDFGEEEEHGGSKARLGNLLRESETYVHQS